MDAAITIERGIPLPRKASGRPAGPNSITGVLRGLEIGDSFLIPYSRARSVYTIASKNGIKVSMCKVSETESRVWRVK